MHGTDQFPLCDPGGYPGCTGFRQRGCVLYFPDQDFDPGEKSVKDRRTDGVSDRAPVRGWQRQGGQERCGERASDPRGSDPQDHRLCGQHWFRSTASGIFPIKGPEGNIEYLLHIRKPEEISEEKLALTEHEAESALQTIIEEKTGLSYTPEWDAVIKGIVDNSHTL